MARDRGVYRLIIILFVTCSVRGESDGLQRQVTDGKVSDFDRVLQGNAFKAFNHPKTGVVYNVDLPSSMSYVKAQTVRLRTGSLRRRGYVLNEFSIPVGGQPVNQVPVRVVLVYRRFPAQQLYQPEGYRIVSPVVGIRVYDAYNLSTSDAVPELGFSSDGFNNLTVKVPYSGVLTVQCAEFDVYGNMTVSNVSGSPNACVSDRLGDFALVVPSGTVSPSPSPSPMVGGPAPRRKRRRSSRWKVILGVTLGVLGGLILLLLLVLLVRRFMRRSKMSKMEQKSDRGEMLQTSLIGGSRTPTAGVSRTKPVLESDYAA